MSARKDVLVSFKAGDCHYCIGLDSGGKWEGIKSQLISAGIDVYDIKIPKMREKMDTNKYYAGLARYQRWFPMIIFFSADDWEDMKAGKDIGTRAVIMNGKYKSSGEPDIDNGKPHTSIEFESIMGWINSIRSSGQLAKSPSNSPSNNSSKVGTIQSTITTSGNGGQYGHSGIQPLTNAGSGQQGKGSIVPLIANPSSGVPYIPNDNGNGQSSGVGTPKMNSVCSNMKLVSRRDDQRFN